MALIECPECKNQVSDTAESCPKCGFAVKAFVKRQKDLERIKAETEQEAVAFVERKMAEAEATKRRAAEEQVQRKDQSYDKAVELFNKHSTAEVKEAGLLFKSLNGWKESNDYLKILDQRLEIVRQEEKQKEISKKIIKRNLIIITISVIVISGIIISIFSFIVPNINGNKTPNPTQTTKQTEATIQAKTEETTVKPTEKPTEKPTQKPTEKPTEKPLENEPIGSAIQIEEKLNELKDSEGLIYEKNNPASDTMFYDFHIRKNMSFCLESVNYNSEFSGSSTQLLDVQSPIKSDGDNYYIDVMYMSKSYHITFTFYDNGVMIQGLDGIDSGNECNGFYAYSTIVSSG